MELEYGKQDYEIYIYKNELSDDYDLPIAAEGVTYKTIDYFKQNKIAMIGTNKYKSPIDACSPKFSSNINGKHTLVFNLYYQYYDYDREEFLLNPFIDVIQNDTLMSLKLDNEWYDFKVVKIQKNSEGTVYNYTAEDANIIELGKNGFNAELSIELENNMGTIIELGEEILKGSDWKVAPTRPVDYRDGGIYSDLIVQSLEDSLYEIEVELNASDFSRRTDYLPDAYYINEVYNYENEDISGKIYVFYNDIVEEKDEIGFLYCGDTEPVLNADGTVVNSYNYVVDKNIIETALENKKLSLLRGLRVVKSYKTRYDHDLGRAVVYFEKNNEGQWEKGYYGYVETNYISPLLAENYLSNSCNMTSLYDWIQLYDSVDDATDTAQNTDHLLLETMPFPERSPYVTYLRANGEFINKGLHGHRTNIKNLVQGETYILAILDHTEGYYDDTVAGSSVYLGTDRNIKSSDTTVGEIAFKVGFYEFQNRQRNVVKIYNNLKTKTEGTIFGSGADGYIDFTGEDTFTITDPMDPTRRKIYKYMEVQSNVTITDITEDYNLDYCLGSFFKTEQDVKIFDVMFFKKYTDNKGELVYPGKVPQLEQGQYTSLTKELLKDYYYIYEDTEVLDSISGKSVLVFSGEDLGTQFRPEYDDSCEKVGSLTGKESNYYTLLSNLTKSFNCWADFIVERDEDGSIIYENCYYSDKGEELDADKVLRYYWSEVTTLPTTNLRLKHITWMENFDQFLLNWDDANPVSTRFTRKELDHYSLNHIYEVDFVGIGMYPPPAKRYFELKSEFVDVEGATTIHVLKRPKKWVRFRKYLNDTPNWGGFKYGLNVKSIQRIEDNDKFSTKVIVKNNSNEFAKNKFCSIARAEDNPTKDNFIIDFNYYLRQGMLDREELYEDLYGEEGYYTLIKNLNEQNEYITDNYIQTTVNKDKSQALWETYFLAGQSASENIQKYINMIGNCGDQFLINLDDWHIGGLWDIRDKTYVVKTISSPEDAASATSYEFFVGMKTDEDDRHIEMPLDGIELPVVYFYSGKNQDDFIKGRFYQVDSETLLPKEVQISNEYYYYFPDYIKPKERDEEEYDEDYEEEVDLADEVGIENLKRYHTYKGNEEYHNKSEYRFNECVYSYCQRIDEHLLKKELYDSLANIYRVALDQDLSSLDRSRAESIRLIKEKNAILNRFLSKYKDFIRESSWSSDNYIDDNLYYLDARDSLHAAAFPKISYNINVADISLLEDYDCYKLKVGDYTFVEDTEFFGWDSKGRPAKEWVVVTEITYDLEQPENNQIKVQNYKTSLEDLFTRLSATLQTLELTIGGYNRLIRDTSTAALPKMISRTNLNNILDFKDDGIYGSTDGGAHYKPLITAEGVDASAVVGQLDLAQTALIHSQTPTLFTISNNLNQIGGCLIRNNCICSTNYNESQGTGWAFYSDGRVIINGNEI